jgi:hypothetical protein
MSELQYKQIGFNDNLIHSEFAILLFYFNTLPFYNTGFTKRKKNYL